MLKLTFMKKLGLLIAIPFLVYSCNNAEKENTEKSETEETTETVEMVRSDLQNEHMFGEVSSYEQTPYTPDEEGNIGAMDSCCIEMEEYDENGFAVKYMEKNSAGEVTETVMMQRDDMGRFTWYTVTENGIVVFKRVIKRDEDGTLLEAIDSDSTGQITSVHKVAEVNENGQALSGKSFQEDGTYNGTWSFGYVDGLRVSNAWTDSTGVQRMQRVGEVNDKGWLAKVVDVRVGDEGDTTTVVETYTYDSFDDMGNWTQRTMYKDDVPTEVLKRTYTYFK
jgi:hypothetical protein